MISISYFVVQIFNIFLEKPKILYFTDSFDFKKIDLIMAQNDKNTMEKTLK